MDIPRRLCNELNPDTAKHYKIANTGFMWYECYLDQDSGATTYLIFPIHGKVGLKTTFRNSTYNILNMSWFNFVTGAEVNATIKDDELRGSISLPSGHYWHILYRNREGTPDTPFQLIEVKTDGYKVQSSGRNRANVVDRNTKSHPYSIKQDEGIHIEVGSTYYFFPFDLTAAELESFLCPEVIESRVHCLLLGQDGLSEYQAFTNVVAEILPVAEKFLNRVVNISVIK